MTAKKLVTKLLVLVPVAALAAFAWLSLPGPEPEQAPGARAQGARGSGVLLHVDADRGAVTIRHDVLPVLDMPAMTMSYPVRDQGQLAGLRAPQRVEFRLGYEGGRYWITEIR